VKNNQNNKHKHVLFIISTQGIAKMRSLAVVKGLFTLMNRSLNILNSNTGHQNGSTSRARALSLFGAFLRLINQFIAGSTSRARALSQQWTGFVSKGLQVDSISRARALNRLGAFVFDLCAGSTSRARALSQLIGRKIKLGHQAGSTSRARALSLFGVLLVVATVLVATFTAGSNQAQAATSNQLNFQGRLLTSTGGLVPDGTYNMEFNLYYQSTGGSSQWTEDRLNTNTQGVTVKNGYFSVYLGQYDSFPVLDWSEDLYLGMTIRGSGSCAWGSCTPTDSEMTPRFKLTSVPYAFRAANVASSSTNAASTNSDGVSITTGNASGVTSNSGNITIDTGMATGTAGQILLGTNNSSGLTLGRSGVTTTLQGSVAITGAGTALTVTNNAVFNGNTTLGNATSDTLTVEANAIFNGSLTVSTGDTFINSGATLNTAVSISNLPTGGAIGTAAATVDGATTFNVNQTTTGQALTLPAPTNTTAGRVVYINNVGTASFTMYGTVIGTNGSNAFIWNGTQWITTVSLSGSSVSVVGTLDSQTKSADGAVIIGNAIYLQTADATNPGLVSTGAQTFAGAKTFNSGLVIAAGESLRVVGGNTASRPISPTEGMVYFDTDTDRLLTYANGKWQADRSDAILVAANNSSQADKDAADFVANGEIGDGQTTIDGDQIEINAALTAAAGKKVVLLAGTYVADATILIPDNTTLTGVGQGTLIEMADIDATNNLIENSNTVNGTGIVVRDMKIDGRRDLNTAGTQYGFYLNNLGSGSGSSAVKGGEFTGIWISRFNSTGFRFNGTANNTISNNTIQNQLGSGIYFANSINSIVSNNSIQGNSLYGITLQTGSSNIIVSNNTIIETNTGGILINNASNNIIENNILANHGSTNNNAIFISGSDFNSIVNNRITDNSCSTSCHAINISDSTSDKNYLEGNRISGSGANAATINDAGTGTIYAGQQTNSTTSTNSDVSDFRFRGSANSATAFAVQNAAGTSVLNVNTTTAGVTVGGTLTVDTTSTFTGLATFNGGLTVEAGDTFTFNGDAFTDFTGGGLVNTGGLLSVDTTSATGFFRNGGNSFGATAFLGTNDGFALALETSGIERLRVTATGNLQVDTDTFFVDAGTNNVGIGNVAPLTRLQIGSTTSSTDEVLTITSQRDAAIRLIADDNDTGEANNPYILFSQDGGSNVGILGRVGVAGTSPHDDSAYTGTEANAFLLANVVNTQAVQIGTNGAVRLTVSGSTGDITLTNNLIVSGTGASSIAGSLTVAGLTTLNGGLTVEAGDTFTFNGDAFTDLTGNGLQVSSNALTLLVQANKGLEVDANGISLIDCGDGQILQYSTGTSQWACADAGVDISTDEIITVAANDTPAAQKASADYIADGTSDEDEINTALTATAGGKVVLLEGTFVVDGTILIPNNTTLEGQGFGTVIELADIDTTDNVIENSDTTTGTGVVIRDLRINGRKDLNTAGTQYGIYLNGMGDFIAGRSGALITGLRVENMRNTGIYLNASQYNIINENSVSENSAYGIYINGSRNIVSDNVIRSNTFYGVYYNSSRYGTISSNIITANASGGVLFASDSSANNVTGNNIYGNGGANFTEGINISASDDISIVGNTFIDVACATNCYAINITNSTSDRTYIADNVFGTSPAQTINDLGTGTILANQIDASGNIRLQASGTANILINSDTDITGTLTVSSTSTFTGLATFNGGLTVEAGDTFTFNGDAFTDFTGGGLTNVSGLLTVDATSATGFFRNGGNSFGASAVLGTNDANSLVFRTNGNSQLTVENGGATTLQNSTNSTRAFRVLASGGSPAFIVDTSQRKVAVGAYTEGSILGQFQVVPTNDNRIGITISPFSATYSSDYLAVLNSSGETAFRIDAPDVTKGGAVKLGSGGGIASGNSLPTWIVTGSTAVGNATGSSGTLYLETGDGRGTNGSSGSIILDVGDANGTGTFGSISLGSANASAITLGRAGLTTTNAGALSVVEALTVTGLTTLNGGLTVETGDTFTFNGDAFTDFTGGGLTNVGGLLTVDATSATGFFRNGGNSFGAAATLGTNDNQPLIFEVNGSEAARIQTSGLFSIGGPLSVTGSTTLGDAAADTTTVRGILNLPDSSGTYPLQFGGDTTLFRQSAGLLVTGGSFTVSQDLGVNGGDIVTDATTFNLINTTATTLNIGGAATSINLGAGTGTTTINNGLTVTGLTTLNGGLTVEAGDTFTFNGDAFTDFTGGGLTNVGGLLTVDATSATGFFRNGGNSFGATATLGTNDAQSLVLETNNQPVVTIANGGSVAVQGSSTSQSAFRVNYPSGVAIFVVDTANAQVGTSSASAASTNTQPLTIRTGSASGTTSNSGNIVLRSGNASDGNSGNINIEVGSATGTFGDINIGGVYRANSINIGQVGTSSILSNVNIATSTAGVQTVNIGSSSTSANATTILGGASGGIALRVASGGTIGIANNAVAQTVTIGNTTGASTVNILSASGGINLTGATSVTGTLTVASATTLNAGLSVSSGATGTIGVLITGVVSQTADLLRIVNNPTDNVNILRITQSGEAIFKADTNSETAFEVQKADGTTIFQVDTTNASQRFIGKTGGSTYTAGNYVSRVMGAFINNTGTATNSAVAVTSGNAATASFYFGDDDDTDIGQINYSNSTNSFTFVTNNTTALTIDSSQAANFAGTLSVQGATLSVGTASTTTGGITLLNATNPFGVTISASNQTVGSALISFPDTLGVADTFCLATVNNCNNSNAFVNGGNSFGTLAVLGTNDAYDLQIEVAGTTVATFDNTDGSVFFRNSSNSTTAFSVQNFAGSDILSVDTSNYAVKVSSTVYKTVANSTCGTNCTITQGNVDTSAAIIVEATTEGLDITLPDPTDTTAGRLVYITAANGSEDFTLVANPGGGLGVEQQIAMRQNTTATMIWDGTNWTAAGASSSTTLQAAYDNTLTAAGGAEIILNNTASSNGLTVRNNATNPIIGEIFEAQTSIGSNLFSVNNNAIEYATNGGAETAGASPSTFPASTWSATPDGGTVSRYTTIGDYVATGQGSVSVVTGATANQGAANRLNTALTPNLRYAVSFAIRGTTSVSTLDVYYSPDGTNTGTVACATGQTITQGAWTRITCSFDAPASGITSSNAIFIRQSDATARTYYIENLSVNVKADVNHAADGSVDDVGSFATNWTAAPGGGTVTRDTTIIYDTSGSTEVVTTATIGHGITNNMSITPTINTQYLVTFYARSSNTFNDIRVRYSRDGGTNFVNCVDYNTQSVSTVSWTRITCLLTTDGTTPTNGDLVIDQPTAVARTFYVDALSVTLNTNTASNVKIGGGALGGPTTLLTLDRSAGPPVAANNDAYLGSMYYDTITGRIQCYESGGWGTCGAPPDNIVNLNPEYAGSVLNGTGVGTMQADVCANQSGVLLVNSTLCAAGEARNYYQWTSPQATQQTYSIYITYQLPNTFDGFSSDDTVQLTGRVSNTTNAAVTYEMFRSQGGSITKCGTGETTVATTANTWQTVGINGNEATSCGFNSSSANAFVLFKLNLKSNSNATAYVSTLTFTTTGR
jgi:parallel beta-helix repeat protein